jgi:hypothetical protein
MFPMMADWIVILLCSDGLAAILATVPPLIRGLWTGHLVIESGSPAVDVRREPLRFVLDVAFCLFFAVCGVIAVIRFGGELLSMR